MDDKDVMPRDLTRIVCITHHLLRGGVAECLDALSVDPVWISNARCVRLRVRPRLFGLLGRVAELDDSPMDVFRMTVPRCQAGHVTRALTDAAGLYKPGHGMLYAQDVVEYSRFAVPEIKACPDSASVALHNMVLFTLIVSMADSGENPAKTALNLGAGVPVISRGIGTGVRDRLGLLRVTIPPEKEIVRLMIPAHDADSIMSMLVEEWRMNRPGGGFLYQTAIREGVVDPLLRVGAQGHPASMEQVIAALDDLKGDTLWRQRFDGVVGRPEEIFRLTRRDYRELTFICAEGYADDMVRVAMESGAGGATTSIESNLRGGKVEDGGGSREVGVLCVPLSACDSVLNALCEFTSKCHDAGCRVQVLDAPAVFTHQRRN